MAYSKKLLPGICLCLGITVLTGSTIAFFTSYDRIHNRVGVGFNETVIEEEFPSPTPATPGQTQTFSKKVQVQNRNSVPCFVRVSISFSDSDIGQATALVNLNEDDWIFCSAEENAKLGGYYYYKEVLLPGDITRPLFDGIQITSDADFSLQNPEDTFDVIVYEESVQQGSFTSYADAWNHFIRE